MTGILIMLSLQKRGRSVVIRDVQPVVNMNLHEVLQCWRPSTFIDMYGHGRILRTSMRKMERTWWHSSNCWQRNYQNSLIHCSQTIPVLWRHIGDTIVCNSSALFLMMNKAYAASILCVP